MNASILGLSKRDIEQGLRRDRRVLRAREVHRHAGAALLVGHVRPARLRGRGQRRPRHPPRRRGALGRRRGVPAQVPRAGRRSSSARAARSCSSRTPPTSCAGSASAAIVLDHGEIVADAPPGEAVRTFRESLQRSGLADPTVEAAEAAQAAEAGAKTPSETIARPQRWPRRPTHRVKITNVTIEHPGMLVGRHVAAARRGDDDPRRRTTPTSRPTTCCSGSRSTTRTATTSSARTRSCIGRRRSRSPTATAR